MKAALIVFLALVSASAHAHNHDSDRSESRHSSRDDFDSRWERTQRNQERDRRTNSDRLCEGQSRGCQDHWSYRD